MKGSDKSLSERGWRRASALAVIFASGKPNLIRAELPQPDLIYASGTLTSGSLRPQQTVQALSVKLGITTNTAYNPSKRLNQADVPGEQQLMAEVLTKTGVILISWQHELIPEIASHIPLVPGSSHPAQWNNARFDLVWIFDLVSDPDKDAPLYRFIEVAQNLLDDDAKAADIAKS